MRKEGTPYEERLPSSGPSLVPSETGAGRRRAGASCRKNALRGVTKEESRPGRKPRNEKRVCREETGTQSHFLSHFAVKVTRFA